MRLTRHTDYGLRMLMMSAILAPRPVAVRDVAERFQISPHHLMKVAQHLTRLGWIEPVRGRTGGFKLARPAQSVRVGEIVRQLEGEFGLVECLRDGGQPCRITPACRLRGVLVQATEAFLEVLDAQTLADLVEQNPPLIRLLEVAS